MQPLITPSIVSIVRDIEQEIGLVRQKQVKTDGLSAYLASEEAQDDICRCYSRVQGHLERLMLNLNVNMWKTIDEQGTESRLERLPHSPAAEYASAQALSLGRGSCTEDTRVDVLSVLSDWAHDAKDKKLYWLNGMAGTGKTTIAYSLCERLAGEHKLAASFFCSRQLPACRDVNLIASSIAHQLTRFSRPFRYALSRRLEANPEMHNQPLHHQFRQLVIEPLKEIQHTLPADVVVVIDALDECDNSKGKGGVLDVLLTVVEEVPVKFMLTSRPDEDILQSMKSGRDARRELRLHELDQSGVQDDIRTYLQANLGELVNMPQLETLVRRSGALFIYAATVVRYVEDANPARRRRRLKDVLELSDKHRNESEREIDALYTTVLAAALDDDKKNEEERNEARLVLYTVVCAQEPLSVSAIARLLGLEVEESVLPALESLLSVLLVSDGQQVVTTLHQSFPDYLVSVRRSSRFHCDEKLHHARLARLLLDKIRLTSPAFNICRLESSYVFDKGVPDLCVRIASYIPEELCYACRYWVAHVLAISGDGIIISSVSEILSQRLLLWMEVMNLTGHIHDAVHALYKLHKWCQSEKYVDKKTSEMARDSWQFVTSYATSPTSLSTPHIYVSTLSFWPKHRPVAQRYVQKTPTVVDAASTAMMVRRRVPMMTIQNEAFTTSLEYSPDGAYIAVGSLYGKIRVCDARTGRAVGDPMTLQPDPHNVKSICYSPDGVHIACTYSKYPDILIWDTHTSQPHGQPLRGHDGPVNSAVYSSDGARIISGSDDTTVRVWDAHTGLMIGQPLSGHTGSIQLITVPPSASHVASVSWDRTVRIWNTLTGQLVCDPIPTGDHIVQLVYSPDGTRLASVSRSGLMCSWDAQTGQTESVVTIDPRIGTAAYSPGLTYIAHLCGESVPPFLSHKCCIREACTGRMVGQLSKDPGDWMTVIVYSPDGTYIASGSGSTVCIWDAHASQQETELVHGHEDTVTAVAFSPDGRHIASASSDKTVRVWDAYTGEAVLEPLRVVDRGVTIVAYSPNGRYVLICCTYELLVCTGCWMKVWDTHTGSVKTHPTDKWVNAAAWSPDGAYVVFGKHNEPLQYWKVDADQLVTTPPLYGRGDCRAPFSFSPDGTCIAALSESGDVRIWEVNTSETVGQPLVGHTEAVRVLVHSSDGAMVATSSDWLTRRVWDAQSGQAVGTAFPTGEKTSGPVICLLGDAYIPCHGCETVYRVSESGSPIQIWDVGAGHSIRPLYGHTSVVQSLAGSPDGAFFASGSYDRTVRVWNTGLVRAVHRQDRDGTHVHDGLLPRSLSSSVLPTDSHICSSSCTTNGYHRVWKLNKDGWVVLDDDKLLLWVPLDLRDTVLYPFNTLLISQKGSLRLEFEESKIGDHWQEHFRPVSSSGEVSA